MVGARGIFGSSGVSFSRACRISATSRPHAGHQAVELSRASGATHGRLHMRWSLLAALSASPLVLSALAAFAAAPSSDPARISGPVTHENLTVFFIHGKSAPGKLPLTLQEALAKPAAEARVTGNVNHLQIVNNGNVPA